MASIEEEFKDKTLEENLLCRSRSKESQKLREEHGYKETMLVSEKTL
jgi:hypothetical protein